MNVIGRMSRPADVANYYMPYTSGDDTGTDTDIDSDAESNISDLSEDLRIRQEQDPRYAILRKPTVNMNTSEEQLEYMNRTTGLNGAPWDESTNINSLEDHVYLLPPKTTKTSLISIKSTNRDRNVFPTPFNFQLKLPRTYKNVTKFQLVQLSFPNSSNGVTQPNIYLSSFINKMINDGIPSSCLVSCISIINCATPMNGFGMYEEARTTESGNPLMTTLSIPPGNYTNNQMAQELTLQSNNTPPLNIISYENFKDIFTNTRDISQLFNEPGEHFFSKTNNIRYNAHTKENIMNTYYTQQHIDRFSTITEQIAFTAYYFPIIKEVIATELAQPFITIDETLQQAGITYEEIKSRVMGVFEGLDSDLYYQVCSTNRSALDVYRPNLTFELRNINKYRWAYTNNKFSSIHDSLHPSITRDIGKAMNNAMNYELTLAGLTPSSFSVLKTKAIGYAAITKHLEANLSTCLWNYHFAGGYHYTGGSTHMTTQSTFSTEELSTDIEFTTMFSYTSTFGRLYGNYEGVRMKFTNFADYHSTLSSYYAISESTNNAIYQINTGSQTEYHTYISSKYAGVMPAKILSNKSYVSNQGIPVSFITNRSVYIPGHSMRHSMNASNEGTITPVTPIDTVSSPIASPPTNLIINPSATDATDITDATDFTPVADIGQYIVLTANTTGTCNEICCDYLHRLMASWYSCLPTNLVIGSLTYRLGLINLVPNTFNLLSTVSQITSTGNLNFFMQINDEQGFNNLDVVMNENYTVTNDTTGQVKLMAAKILMGNVGDTGISQTLIQNPSLFETTLGKLDKLSIKIYYDDDNLTPAWQYLPFLLDIHEWDATFQVDEEIGFANQHSGWGNRPSIPVPTNPNDTPYLGFTHRNNPNNA